MSSKCYTILEKARNEMDFQRARTKEQIDSRQEEIIAAADRIYKSDGFDAVHFKSIAELTSFSRPTIYNYYNTKEEVLLDVLKREYLAWLDGLADWEETGRESPLSHFLSESLKGRENFLRLLSVDYTRIELGSSVEKLTEYKQSIQPVYRKVKEIVDASFPDASEEQRDDYSLAVFGLMGGLFPLLHLSEKQKTALAEASPDTKVPGFYGTFERLLGNVGGNMVGGQ